MTDLAAMNRAIDDAAQEAGRRPGDARRMYNLNGEFRGRRGLLQGDPELVPVVGRLEQVHTVIADVLDQVDRALVALVTEPDGIAQLRASVDVLTDTMLSHLSYEERELVEPLARLGYY